MRSGLEPRIDLICGLDRPAIVRISWPADRLVYGSLWATALDGRGDAAGHRQYGRQRHDARDLAAGNPFWGALSGIGTGVASAVLGATVANRWFFTRRGLITGIFGAATSAGQLAFVPLLVWLAETIGPAGPACWC